jgi:hypothetical protein
MISINNYAHYHAANLHGLRITNEDIQILIKELDSELFNVELIGNLRRIKTHS